jgi:hypothetical protein
MPHARKILLFGLLSAADLFLTWRLLRQADGQVYESNPIANWWLVSYGWPGLAAFKLAVVVLAMGLSIVLSRAHPRAGARVLEFACSALLVVVLYSCSLFGLLAQRPQKLMAEEFSRLEESNRCLDKRISTSRAFTSALAQLTQELVARRCRLAAAVDQIAGLDRARDAAWLQRLRLLYGVRSDRECLAANLIHHAVNSLEQNPSAAGRLADELEKEFQSAYGTLHRCHYHWILTLGEIPKDARENDPSASVSPVGGFPCP